MCSEPLPKEFEKTTEVLPFTKYGISSLEEFRNAESDIRNLELLKKAGLSDEEIKLYRENEEGLLEQRKKIESNVLKSKLETIYNKINTFHCEAGSSKTVEEQPSTSKAETLCEKLHKKPLTFYPEGHPMNELKEIEESLFGHLKNDDIIPITKRRKILRRFERKKERLLSHEKQLIPLKPTLSIPKSGSLWDLQEIPIKIRHEQKRDRVIGPKKQTMYTIKDNKIVRLEPIPREGVQEEYQAVDIVMPVNAAEEQLLEGTKMSIDDIKKIDRFKDYEPGIPSKVLYLKNIAPTVSQEQLSLLFNQFLLENGGPIHVRLLSGRMRGQAFVSLQTVDLAIRALEEINGTILSGRPVIAQFGRNTNRIQDQDDIDNR